MTHLKKHSYIITEFQQIKSYGALPQTHIRHVAEGRGKTPPTPLPERIFSASRQGQGERQIFFWKSDQKKTRRP